MKCIGLLSGFARCLGVLLLNCTFAIESGWCQGESSQEMRVEGVSTREARQLAERGVPLERLHPNIRSEVREVLENPSYFRRMPTQQIACDPRMFTFLVRRPEVMVNIWEVMGITKVKAQRTSPMTFLADDGLGTACRCDLIFSDERLHIYFGNGIYDGSMAPRKVTGRCVCLLRTEQIPSGEAEPTITGTMDVFLKVDNFGADLLTRTIGPFVGKTADYNFVETAKFITQISDVCQNNPAAAQALVMRLERVDDATRREFLEIVTDVGGRSEMAQAPLASRSSSPGNRLAEQAAAPQVPLEKLAIVEAALPTSSREAVAEHLQLSPSASPAAGSQLVAPTSIVPRKGHIYMRR